MKTIFGLLLASLLSQHSEASALFIQHLDTHEIEVQAHFIVYGKVSTPERAQIIADQINNLWNAPKAKVILNGQEFLVRFAVTAESMPLMRDAWKIAKYNTNDKINFIRLTDHSRLYSAWRGRYENTGIVVLRDLEKSPTTVAHEFGHALGLRDGYPDLRGWGQPGIMQTRGSYVDPQFQYDPQAAAGDAGGTLNPFKRVVLARDVQSIEFRQMNFDSNGVASFGTTSNRLLSANAEDRPFFYWFFR